MQPQCTRSSAFFGSIAMIGRRAIACTTISSMLLILAVAGCWQAPHLVEPESPKPFAGHSLTVDCRAAVEQTDLIVQLTRDWSARSGAKVTVLSTGQVSGDGDIHILAPAEFPRIAASGKLLEVPSPIRGPTNKYQWAEMPSVYADKLLRWDGKAYALPVAAEGHVLVCRVDRFNEIREDYEKQYKEPLHPPETWDELVRIAEFFQSKTKTPSLPPLSERAEDVDRLFYSIAAPYDRRAATEIGRELGDRKSFKTNEDQFFSFHYDLQTGEPRIAGPAFVHALSLMQRMQKCRPAGNAASPSDAFLKGEAVMCLAPLDALARFQSANSRVRDKFVIVPMPGSHFYFDYRSGQRVDMPSGTVNRLPYVGWGGAVGVVSSSCTSPDAAWDLLANIGDPTQTSLEVIGSAKWGAGPFRMTHLESRYRGPWLGYGLSTTQTDRLIEQLRYNLGTGMSNYRVRLRTPDEHDHLQALNEFVRATLSKDGADPKAALADAANRWKEISARVPDGKWRERYRKSLGL